MGGTGEARGRHREARERHGRGTGEAWDRQVSGESMALESRHDQRTERSRRGARQPPPQQRLGHRLHQGGGTWDGSCSPADARDSERWVLVSLSWRLRVTEAEVAVLASAMRLIAWAVQVDCCGGAVQAGWDWPFLVADCGRCGGGCGHAAIYREVVQTQALTDGLERLRLLDADRPVLYGPCFMASCFSGSMM